MPCIIRLCGHMKNGRLDIEYSIPQTNGGDIHVYIIFQVCRGHFSFVCVCGGGGAFKSENVYCLILNGKFGIFVEPMFNESC